MWCAGCGVRGVKVQVYGTGSRVKGRVQGLELR